MTAHDVYVISPYLGVAGVAILVILADLVVPRKGVLPVLAFLGLLVPLSLSLVQAFDLGDSVNLVRGADPLATGETSVLLGSLSLDRFALFFNFLVLAASGAVILASTEYVRRMERFQGEYYGLILFSATGMMLLAGATELITIYISLELMTLPLAALAAFLMSPKSSEAGMKFLIIGAISSAIMLYGMALVFGFAGSTGLADIAANFQNPAQVEGLPVRQLRHVGRGGADSGRVRLQNLRGAIPNVGPRRLRRGTHTGGGLPVGGEQGGCLRGAAAGLLYRVL